MPADEGGASRLTCLLAGNCCPQLTDSHQLDHCPQLAHWMLACLAIENLPLLAAFRRGSESCKRGREAVAFGGRQVQRRVCIKVDQDLKRRLALILAHPKRLPRVEDTEHLMQKARLLAGLIDPHLVPSCEIHSSDEGISNGDMHSGRDSHGDLILRSIVR